MLQQKLNIRAVLFTLDNSIEQLEEGLNPVSLSNKEQATIDEALKDVIRLGLKIKLQYQKRKIDNIIKSLDEDDGIDLIKIQLINSELDRVLKIING